MEEDNDEMKLKEPAVTYTAIAPRKRKVSRSEGTAYYISAAVKALETGFQCPEDLSGDYKKELAEARVRKCR